MHEKAENRSCYVQSYGHHGCIRMAWASGMDPELRCVFAEIAVSKNGAEFA